MLEDRSVSVSRPPAHTHSRSRVCGGEVKENKRCPVAMVTQPPMMKTRAGPGLQSESQRQHNVQSDDESQESHGQV